MTLSTKGRRLTPAAPFLFAARFENLHVSRDTRSKAICRSDRIDFEKPAERGRFAGHAMAALIRNKRMTGYQSETATEAYQHADAMMLGRGETE